MLVATIRPKKFDLAVVGHIVFDQISRGGSLFKTQLGSPCVYASLGARALDASVVVAGKVGEDFNQRWVRWLKAQGVTVSHISRANTPTTSFRISYEDGSRTMWAMSRCSPLTKQDLSGLPNSSSIHLGPILNEIPRTLALSLTERGAITCLDPQGYLRRMLGGGLIGRSKWLDRGLLKKLDVLKLSDEEASIIIGRARSQRKLMCLGPQVILITRGASGTIVWSRELGMFRVPAFKTKVRDPTGAGDALVGALLVTWIRTGDLLWSVAMGSAVASFVVEKVGPASFGTARQIQRRASVVSEGTIKLH